MREILPPFYVHSIFCFDQIIKSEIVIINDSLHQFIFTCHSLLKIEIIQLLPKMLDPFKL